MADDGTIVPLPELRAFVIRCMASVGIAETDGGALAELLVAADYRGHFSHGLNVLEFYILNVKNGTTATSGSPSVIKETVATSLVDGCNVLGPVVGKFCMDLAIEKARSAGIGWVVARGSNHFGIAGWYGLRAMDQGMIGMSFTNTSPGMVPTRAKENVLGTNPICCAAPAKDGDGFVLDMATTTVAMGKVRIAEQKGASIPEGWVLTSDGRKTTDPGQMAGMCPLGAEESTSSYKGYGLAMMVEVFCGILAGAQYGPRIRKWPGEMHRQADLGQCFVAIDPRAFADGFEDRMSDLIDYCRNLQPADGKTEVLVPGDPERKHMAKCDQQGGILYHSNQIKKVVAETFKCLPFTS